MGKLIIIERVGIGNIDISVQADSGGIKLFEINSKYKNNTATSGIRIPLDKNGNRVIMIGYLEQNLLKINQSDSDYFSAFYIFGTVYLS